MDRSGEWFFAVLLLSAGFSRGMAAEELVTLHQLRNLTPKQAAEGPPVRIKGVVVCCDAGWHQLYIHDGYEALYFNADDFPAQSAFGQSVEITGRARGTNVL